MPTLKLPRQPVVVAVNLAVAALHFVTGPTYAGPLRPFVTGYLIDLALPFALVLLLGVGFAPHPRLRRPALRALLVFAVGAVVEGGQYLGLPIPGRTFDPLDLLAYAAGALAALGFERLVFAPIPEPPRG